MGRDFALRDLDWLWNGASVLFIQLVAALIAFS
jgi:hypothetical protein